MHFWHRINIKVPFTIDMTLHFSNEPPLELSAPRKNKPVLSVTDSNLGIPGIQLWLQFNSTYQYFGLPSQFSLSTSVLSHFQLTTHFSTSFSCYHTHKQTQLNSLQLLTFQLLIFHSTSPPQTLTSTLITLYSTQLISFHSTPTHTLSSLIITLTHYSTHTASNTSHTLTSITTLSLIHPSYLFLSFSHPTPHHSFTLHPYHLNHHPNITNSPLLLF